MSILAAIDGEQSPSRVVEVGHELASQFDEELLVLHVMSQEVFDELNDATTTEVKPVPLAPGITYSSESKRSTEAGSKTTYTIQDGEEDAADVVRDVVEATLDDPRDVTSLGRVGEPVEEILDVANRRSPRYLVVGGRKRTPVGKAIFGSSTQSILLNTDYPVMTVMREE